MIDFKKFIEQHSNEIDHFFTNTDSLIVIHLDKELNILAHNECFQKIIKSEEDCSGRKINSFLLPESQGVLPLPDSQNHLSVGLNFTSSDSFPLPMYCHIFKTDNDSYLLLGGNLMLTNDDFLQKMTVLTNEIANVSRDLYRKNRALKEAYSKIKMLSGIIPICMHCKEIRDDKGYWNKLEEFITEHSEAQFSHSICDKCLKNQYPDL